MTKTLIDVDDDLLDRVMKLTGATTKKAAVNEALAQAARRAMWTCCTRAWRSNSMTPP